MIKNIKIQGFFCCEIQVRIQNINNNGLKEILRKILKITLVFVEVKLLKIFSFNILKKLLFKLGYIQLS